LDQVAGRAAGDFVVVGIGGHEAARVGAGLHELEAGFIGEAADDVGQGAERVVLAADFQHVAVGEVVGARVIGVFDAVAAGVEDAGDLVVGVVGEGGGVAVNGICGADVGASGGDRAVVGGDGEVGLPEAVEARDLGGSH